MDNENYRVHESLGYLVHRTSRLIRKYFNKELTRKGYSLTGEQYDVLFHLWHRDEQQQHELAKGLCKDKTTITRLIKGIESLNLVRRISNKDDKREKLVCLTASGKAVVKELASLAQAILERAQKGITSSNIAVCKEVLTQIGETISRELTKND
jgi:DNA-binding MarR family transcriptional regulator